MRKVDTGKTRTDRYTIRQDVDLGEIIISEEVVAIIAGLAATEVEGVESMAGNITKELVARLGMSYLSHGVKVHVKESSVTVDLALILKYGYAIPDVSKSVQEKVKSAIETMTGLSVDDVNITIAGIGAEKAKQVNANE
ncbi:MAG: Asp23/Gls24 family envelope stress response protein [Lachnospira sp.]|nr:Asp23/Gls24 family envelope stress response protein [Lachnospira sp.]